MVLRVPTSCARIHPEKATSCAALSTVMTFSPFTCSSPPGPTATTRTLISFWKRFSRRACPRCIWSALLRLSSVARCDCPGMAAAADSPRVRLSVLRFSLIAVEMV